MQRSDNDTSVTGFAVMALKSAELSGIEFDVGAYDGVRVWLRLVANPWGFVGYRTAGDRVVAQPSRPEGGRNLDMTAVGLFTKILVDGRRDEPWMARAADNLVKTLPRWEHRERGQFDYYGWYYTALALFQWDAPEGRAWQEFNASLKRILREHDDLRRGGCEEGSWGEDEWNGRAILGRIYGTAMAVITLEVYYRYPRMFNGE